MLVRELRAALKKRGLDTSGKKAALEKRLDEAVAKDAAAQVATSSLKVGSSDGGNSGTSESAAAEDSASSAPTASSSQTIDAVSGAGQADSRVDRGRRAPRRRVDEAVAAALIAAGYRTGRRGRRGRRGRGGERRG